jgi:hypothetical protein
MSKLVQTGGTLQTTSRGNHGCHYEPPLVRLISPTGITKGQLLGTGAATNRPQGSPVVSVEADSLCRCVIETGSCHRRIRTAALDVVS